MQAQVRPASTAPITAADLVDTMEMVLGALGREAVGMGADSDNPADDPAWVGMDFQGKLESFAPVWRVMRGEALPLEDVEEQLRALTGVMKAASAESDIRNHQFTGIVQVSWICLLLCGVMMMCAMCEGKHASVYTSTQYHIHISTHTHTHTRSMRMCSTSVHMMKEAWHPTCWTVGWVHWCMVCVGMIWWHRACRW